MNGHMAMQAAIETMVHSRIFPKLVAGLHALHGEANAATWESMKV